MNRSSKLAFLANGKSIHIKRWLLYFVDRGYDVHLMTFSPEPIEGVEIHSLEYFGRAAYIIRALKIRRIVKKVEPDILHAHYVSHYGVYGALTGFHPFIISVWGSDILRDPKDSMIRRYFISYALKRADIITTTAEFTGGYLVGTFDISRSKIVRIPWGVDLEVFTRGYINRIKEFRARLGISNNAPVILSNRHMDPKYEIESIINAIPHVLKSYPNAIFIFIRGAGSSKFENEMKKKVKRMGIHPNVIFIQRFVTPREMAIYLNMADIFLSIPKTDQFGSSVIEGMACGSIPIVSDIEVYKQYLKDGVNAFFVDPDSPKEIAERIIYCIEHPEIKDEFYSINRRIVEEKEDWNKCAKKMEELYERLLAS